MVPFRFSVELRYWPLSIRKLRSGPFWYQFSGILLCIIVVMPEADSAKYRKLAEECRAQATMSVSVLDKEAWLRTAEECLKLAIAVEKHPG